MGETYIIYSSEQFLMHYFDYFESYMNNLILVFTRRIQIRSLQFIKIKKLQLKSWKSTHCSYLSFRTYTTRLYQDSVHI